MFVYELNRKRYVFIFKFVYVYYYFKPIKEDFKENGTVG